MDSPITMMGLSFVLMNSDVFACTGASHFKVRGGLGATSDCLGCMEIATTTNK